MGELFIIKCFTANNIITNSGFRMVAKVEGNDLEEMKNLYRYLCDIPVYKRVIFKKVTIEKQETEIDRMG